MNQNEKDFIARNALRFVIGMIIGALLFVGIAMIFIEYYNINAQ